MTEYVYAFVFTKIEDDVFFSFKDFPDIISALSLEEFHNYSLAQIEQFAKEAVITHIQTLILRRVPIPKGSDISITKADGFVILPVQQAMKLELYKLYLANCTSVADFARHIAKAETSARRLLDFNHQSLATEIESAIATFGKRISHRWHIEISPKASLEDSRKKFEAALS